MPYFILFTYLFSFLSGLGLFWILKYKIKLLVLKNNSRTLKIISSLILTNFFIWFNFIVQAIIFKVIVLNDKSYELSDGNMGFGFTSKDVGEKYIFLSELFYTLTSILFITIFILGLILRNKLKASFSNILEKPKLKLMLLLFFILIIFLLVSLILFVYSLDFGVSYQIM